MERPVGDKFKLNGCVYVVVKDDQAYVRYPCAKCAFRCVSCSDILDIVGVCGSARRKDGVSVHFEHFGVDW